MRQLGKQIYDLIQDIKNSKILTGNIFFRITKVVIDWDKSQILAFYVKFNITGPDYKRGSELDNVVEMLRLFATLFSKGYRFNEEQFKLKECNDVVTILSFLKKQNDYVSREFSKACVIKLIHYYISKGKDFNEFYLDISKRDFLKTTKNEGYTKILDIGPIGEYYKIFKMCYEYYINGTIPELIEDVVMDQIKTFKVAGLWGEVKLNHMASEIALNVNVKEYGVKFCDMSDPYSYFLASNTQKILDLTNIKIVSFIYSIEDKRIGYRYEKGNNENCKSFLELSFESQKDILDFLSKLKDKITSIVSSFELSRYNFFNEYDLENSIKVVNPSNKDLDIKVISIEDVFRICTISREGYYQAFNKLFIKMYSKFLREKYGNMLTKKEFLEKPEIRYIPPKIAKKIISYSIYNDNNFSGACGVFLDEKLYDDVTAIYYDNRLIFRPTVMKLTFLYELKNIGIKLKRGQKCRLPDGRELVILKKQKKFEEFKKIREKNISNIQEKFEFESNPKINICDASEIIVSRNLDKNGMYTVLGYITDRIGDRVLTDNVLMNLSNKEFLSVVANLYTNFDSYYIESNSISIDKDMNYYIDVCDSNIQIQKHKKENKHIVTVLERLAQDGFNLERFKGIDLKQDKDTLLQNISNLNVYCSKHNHYYSKNEECPICSETVFIVGSETLKKFKEIYKDDIATHYKADGDEVLKIYNKDCSFLDMKKIEDNVDKLIAKRYIINKDILEQNMFLPIKKAVMINNPYKHLEFVGYYYILDKEATPLDDRNDCIRIDNQNKLKNLQRVKGCIRLITQYLELVKQNKGFMTSKFGSAVISKEYPKQVQLINPEFIIDIVDSTQSDKYLSEYIYSILKGENIISKEIIENTSFLYIKLKLEEYVTDMTKYCPYHNVYYSKKKFCCPECMSKDDIKYLDIIRVNKSDIKKWKPFNEGGESYIYRYSTDGNISKELVKIFKDEEINNEFKTAVISKIIKKRWDILSLNGINSNFEYIIPQKLVIDNNTNNIIGYTMKRVKGNSLSTLRDKKEVEKLKLSLKDRMEILINVGEGIKNLHEKCNIFIGDLNGRNILFDKNKKVYFLDFDGMGIDDISPEFYTDGYVDPISQKNKCITMKDDWYSYAIQAFYYLTFTHPFNGIYVKTKDNKNVELDIIEKMEKRISLLGNHGMTVPTVADDWSWMTENLKNAFLNIFEGDYRGDIIELLKQQNTSMLKIKGDVESSNGKKSVNITIEEINPFGEDMIEVITEKVCIIGKNNDKALLILLKDSKKIITLEDYSTIRDVIISDDERLAFVIFEENLEVYDIEFNTKLYQNKIDSSTTVRVNDRVLYYNTKIESDELHPYYNNAKINIICKVIFKEDNTTEKIPIKFHERVPNKAFNVYNNEKFIIIKEGRNTNSVFCNDYKIGTITEEELARNYNILYDKYTKKWLIIGDDGIFTIIFPDGEYKNISKPQIENCNVEKIVYTKGKIYVPLDEQLYIFNTETQEEKTLTLDKHIYKSSRISINKDGFTVITNCKMYKYRLN